MSDVLHAGRGRLLSSTWLPALVSAVLLWAALPPLGRWVWPVAWIAPVGWIVLIRRERLAGRRPYLVLYGVGFLFWLASLHWLRLPHPATSIGWVALAIYFGVYLPLFVGLSRVAVHRLRVSVVIAAPAVWTGLEFGRGHVLGGMTMGSLGHTQVDWVTLIQIADLGGAYLVGLLVMLVAACLGRMIPLRSASTAGERWRGWPLLPAAGAVAATLVYGIARLNHEPDGPPEPILTAGIIQGSIDTELTADPRVRGRIHRHYVGLSERAVRRWDDLDVILWPETTFRDPLFTFDPDASKPPYATRITQEEFRWNLQNLPETPPEMTRLARRLGVPMILGFERLHFAAGGQYRYNCAGLVTADGELLRPVYDKMHPVMFGEYVPLARRFPLLQRITPLADSLTAGRRAVGLEVAGVRLAPNICYESVLPHLVRRQVLQLRRRGEEPDALVNLTNDGWFWGSSELDMHLACGVFRAVECRKPMLIAANTGFSAHIDGSGRILRRGPRRRTAVLRAEVRGDRRRSPYLSWGDWPAGLCAAACVGLAIVGIVGRFSRRGTPR
ncbi:MAG: apolipoprotein N-acyltransferase [Pirellulales bacterium]